MHFTNILATFVKSMFRNMNNRLQQFLAAENISQSQFADTINVARASVSHILAGRNKPGWDFLNNMMRHYPNLNIEWLLNGTGKMYKTQLRQEEFKQDVKPAEEIPADLFTPQENPAPETPRESKISSPLPVPAPNIETSERKDSPADVAQHTDTQKKITKIVIFYDDNTFVEIK